MAESSARRSMIFPKAKNATIDVTAFPKYQEKLKEVNELQEIVDKLINGDTSEIQGRKNNIIDLINNIDKQLNERAIQERTKERIKELENEEENILFRFRRNADNKRYPAGIHQICQGYQSVSDGFPDVQSALGTDEAASLSQLEGEATHLCPSFCRHAYREV